MFQGGTATGPAAYQTRWGPARPRAPDCKGRYLTPFVLHNECSSLRNGLAAIAVARHEPSSGPTTIGCDDAYQACPAAPSCQAHGAASFVT